MTCKNCGAQIPENETKCPNCGTNNSAEELNISAAGAERAVPRGFSAKKNIIIIIIAAILIIGGGITAIAVVNSHSASSGVSDKLQLAERYLNEQNYEQAIIEYQKVLEIEPMNVDAYLGLADAYLGMGDTDKALEWLNNGYEQTGDARILAMIGTLTTPVESDISASETSLPEFSESAISKPELPAYGAMGFVTIVGVEYDIATTAVLDLSDSNITDEQLKEIVPEIAKLTNLTELYWYGNQISDITPLANLTNLEILNLSDNQISDTTPLANLTNLTALDLDHNQISNITPLANLTNLTYLYLNDNQICDITPLANLTNLMYLDLKWNKIGDITPLANLTNLKKLELYGNQISDITSLENLTDLMLLDLRSNQIHDITPLFSLSNLKRLSYGKNQISEADIERLKSKLPNCEIGFW